MSEPLHAVCTACNAINRVHHGMLVDLPNRETGVFQITRTLSGTGVAASCTVWSTYLAAKQ